MSPTHQPNDDLKNLSGLRFFQRIILECELYGMLTLVPIIVFLFPIVRYSPAQLKLLVPILGFLTIGLIGTTLFLGRKECEPAISYLDRHQRGEQNEHEEVQRAFEVVMNFPRWWFMFAISSWVIGGFAIALGSYLRIEGFSSVSALAIAMAAATGGLISQLITFNRLKQYLEPYRAHLTSLLPDPSERESLIKPVSFITKFTFSVSVLIVLTVTFSVTLVCVHASRSIESFQTDQHMRLLEQVRNDVASVGNMHQAVMFSSGFEDFLDMSYVGIDLDKDEVTIGRGHVGSLITESELELILEQASLKDESGEWVQSGNSRLVESPHVFTWVRMASTNEILVAVSNQKSGLASSAKLFGGVLLLVVGLVMGAVLLTYLAAKDQAFSFAALRNQLVQISAGKLVLDNRFESEDEFGELGRNIATMADSLVETVHDVVTAADEMESAADMLASVGDDIVAVTRGQNEGVAQVSSTMTEINQHIAQVTSSASNLRGSVEEVSSSVLELQAVGGNLNDNAGILADKSEATSTSVEQMIREIHQVHENTEALGAASEHVSNSLGEMLSSVTKVDENAEETAQLSREVVGTAEQGQDRVQETIHGMEEIRNSTSSAGDVIQSLGVRSDEIGTIITVINSVTDETKLLALNAAIIAAQAGEHGRAFSVVADEIKSLADRVTSNTTEINDQIHSLQEDSNKAIHAITQSVEQAEGGVEQSAEAGRSLVAITDATRKSGEKIGGIVELVRNQSEETERAVVFMKDMQSEVEQIRLASEGQQDGGKTVLHNSQAMKDIVGKVYNTISEQTQSVLQIAHTIEGVEETTTRIDLSLQEQSAACSQVIEFIHAMQSDAHSYAESAQRMGVATEKLLGRAQALREGIQRFEISRDSAETRDDSDDQ